MIPQKTLFASFAVMAIVAAAFAGISVFGEDSEASVPTGSSSSPLTEVSGSYEDYYDECPTLYVKVGTIVTITATSGYGIDTSATGSSASQLDSSHPYSFKTSFGLYGSDSTSISGTISATGTYKIFIYHDGDDESGPITFIVSEASSGGSSSGSSESTLDFTSPTAVDSVSGSSIKYQAKTNIDGSTFKATGSGNASWLTLTSAGLLSGTAPSDITSKTSYTYSIQATSPGGQTATQKVTFDVYPVAKLTASSRTINGTVGSPITAVTVSSNIACSLSLQDSSKLTDLGLSWNASTGTISGTPSKTGSATVKVLGASSVGPSQSPSIEISVSVGEASLKITSEPPIGTFVPGKNYTYNLTANQDVTWSISGNPSWLSISGSKISGQVVSSSDKVSIVSYSVTATTSGGQTATQQVTITVEPTIEFTTVPVASCSVTPVYTYKADGSFSISKLFGLSIVECDAAVPTQDSQSFVLGNSVDETLNYTAPDAVSAITGSKFTYNPATNITGTTFSKVSGADWLTLTDGVVSGTAPGVTVKTGYQIVIRATSPYNQTIDQTVTITVYPIVKLTASALSTSVHQNSEMNEITVSSNVSVTWSKSGDLPTGVTFSNGKLSGIPSVQGSFPVTIYGASVEGPSQTASIKVTIIVGEPVLEITSDFPTSMFLVGKQYSYTVETNVPNCSFALGSDKPDWAVITGAAISGQISGYTDGTMVEFTVTATSPENQTATQKISVIVEPVIAFTTVPTASCIVMAEYTYSDDGTFVLKNVMLLPLAVTSLVAYSVPAVFDVQDLDAATIDSAVLGADMTLGDDAGGSSESVPAPNVTETGTRTFKFVWTGEDAERVTWDFGDGSTGEGFQITHTYDKNGTYTYTCTGINSVGSSSVSGTIKVDVPNDGISMAMLILIGIFLLIVIAAVVHYSKKRKNAGFSGRRR